jgi:hypothetical protein
VAGWRAGLGKERDEEADTGRGVPGLGWTGLQASGGAVKQAPGEPRDRWPRGTRPLVPDGPRFPSAAGLAAAVPAGQADGLKRAASGDWPEYPYDREHRGFAPITR